MTNLNIIVLILISACFSNRGSKDHSMEKHAIEERRNEWKGLASYYHNSLHGLRTASGELYNKNKFMAAHKTLAFGSWVWVKDHNSPSTVVVKINDRLPANSTRLIDLSYRAAEEFKLIKMGLKKVTIKVIPPSEAKRWFLERQLQLPDELKK